MVMQPRMLLKVVHRSRWDLCAALECLCCDISVWQRVSWTHSLLGEMCTCSIMVVSFL